MHDIVQSEILFLTIVLILKLFYVIPISPVALLACDVAILTPLDIFMQEYGDYIHFACTFRT